MNYWKKQMVPEFFDNFKIIPIKIPIDTDDLIIGQSKALRPPDAAL